MTHLLIIKNAKGEVLARVPVEKGWTMQEVADPKAKAKPAPAPAPAADEEKEVGDDGGGAESVG